MLSMSLDHTDEQIEQKLALMGRKRRKHAFICSARLGADSSPKLSPFRRQIKLPRAPVAMLNTPLNQPFCMEPLDDQARMAGVDAHAFGEAALVYARLDLETKKRPVFQLDHLFADQRFGDD
jgi:hypothetical protein